MHPTANSVAFIRETWMLDALDARRVMPGVMPLHFIELKYLYPFASLVVFMQILHLRSFTLGVLTLFAQCLFCAESVRAHEGWGIVVDRKGQIYFSDIPTNTIWRITREGKLEAFLSNRHSHALVLDEDGSIYGTQEHHAAAIGSVWRIEPESSVSNFFTPSPDFPLNLHPFTIDREGNFYSTNSTSFPNQRDKTTLLKATPNGSVTVLAGGVRGHRDGRGGDAQFSGIDGMAWANDGSLYVTDGVYVRRVTMDGTVTTLGKGALTNPSYGEDLMGLAVSPGGSSYVADYSQRRLLLLMPDGSTQTILETGLFWSPTGVVAAREDLYVLEHLSDAARHFRRHWHRGIRACPQGFT